MVQTCHRMSKLHITAFLLMTFASAEAWGQSLPVADTSQRMVLELQGQRKLKFSQPGSPNIVQAQSIEGQAVDLSFNKDATEVTLALPEGTNSKKIQVLTTDKSQQFADGTIVLSALDASVHGDVASTAQSWWENCTSMTRTFVIHQTHCRLPKESHRRGHEPESGPAAAKMRGHRNGRCQ